MVFCWATKGDMNLRLVYRITLKLLYTFNQEICYRTPQTLRLSWIGSTALPPLPPFPRLSLHRQGFLHVVGPIFP